MKLCIATIVRHDLLGLIRTFNSIHHIIGPHVSWTIWDGGIDSETKSWIASNLQRCQNITYFRGADSGIYDAMNKITDVCDGDYIQYLNAGDIFCGNIEFVLNRLSTPTPKLFLYGANLTFGSRTVVKWPRDPDKWIWHGVTANHQAIIFPLDVVRRVRYDSSYRICGDYDLLCRLYQEHIPFENVRELIAGFDVSGVSFQLASHLRTEARQIQSHVLKLPSWKIFTSQALHRINRFLQGLLK